MIRGEMLKVELHITARWITVAAVCTVALMGLGCEGLGLNPTPIGELSTVADWEDGSVDTGPGALDCVPACDGFSTGPDGCGGTCSVPADQLRAVDEVALNCVPRCQGRVCGDDGCGGSCGRCSDGLACSDGVCDCAPHYIEMCCEMGTQTCWFDGCGNQGKVIETCPDGCHDGACCTPDCRENTCGDDGCGGTCGSCKGPEVCIEGTCDCAPSVSMACCEDGSAVCSYDGCGHQESVQAMCPTGCADGACCDHCADGHVCAEDGSCTCGALGVACPDGFACEDGHCIGGLGDEAFVPTGHFVMGCSSAQGEACEAHADELPRRLVTVEAFAIDRHEVTAADYQTCVTTTGCALPLLTSGSGANYATPTKYEHPINFVTWAQAEDYCDRQDKRLCSEAEWEFAGRGTCHAACDADDVTCCEAMMPLFPWGDSPPTCALANHGNSACGGDTSPVGAYPDGASQYGVMDLSGNVWEWVQDCWHSDYQDAPLDGAPWIEPYGICESNRRVIRGGSYDYGEDAIRLSERLENNPKFGSASVGFRCCRSLED
ncbi:MAG: formylglycine-generating enzyme family protein [Myxococcota bacterium]